VRLMYTIIRGAPCVRMACEVMVDGERWRHARVHVCRHVAPFGRF